MAVLNESLAGRPEDVPDHMYQWAAEQVFEMAKAQGAHPEGFMENVQGK